MKAHVPCGVPGCQLRVYARSYCSAHYRRHRRGMPLDAPVQPRRKEKVTCMVSDCPTHAVSRGYCAAHYARFHRYGDPLAGGTTRKRVKMITFDADRHKYFAPDGRELISVTTLINTLIKPPFDRDRIAPRSAAKRGVSVETILAEWDEKRTRSQVKGDRVHEFIRNHITGTPDEPDPFLQLNHERDLLPEERAFRQFWEMASPTVGQVAHTEFLVGDTELGIAGTVDCIALSPATEQRHVWDWKTGTFNTTNSWDRCLDPFSDLQASELVLYSMQVSLYRLLAERSGIRGMGESYVLHLASDGTYTVHKALDLRERLLGWLATHPIPQPV
jgi:hypothetical protein